MSSIIGKKIGMTQVFTEEGQAIPVTVLQIGPCKVTGIKSVEKDGYSAVQVGFGVKKEKNTSKAEKGHFNKSGKALPHICREIRVEDTSSFDLGSDLDDSFLSEAKFVDVTGQTKGRGFQGVVKRYGLAGGPETHGSNFHRRPGSIGMCSYPAHVFKGKKMPGHMGDVRKTVLSLKVYKFDSEKKLLLVKGAVPGAKNGIVTVRNAVKK